MILRLKELIKTFLRGGAEIARPSMGGAWKQGKVVIIGNWMIGFDYVLLITGNKVKKDSGICLSGMKLRTLGRAIGSEPVVLNLEDGRGSKQVTGGLLISKKIRMVIALSL